MFENREIAGQELGKALKKYKNKDAIVYALPRGGVVLGREVADALEAPLDILVTRKIGHPENSEYGICVVGERGDTLCEEEAIKLIDPEWFEQEVKKEQAEARRRVAKYRGSQPALDPAGKIAILVDDGIATGLNMRLAVRALLTKNPKKIVVAVPMASEQAVADLKREGVNDIVLLMPAAGFSGAIGAHYIEFPQVGDEEVVRLLK